MRGRIPSPRMVVISKSFRLMSMLFGFSPFFYMLPDYSIFKLYGKAFHSGFNPPSHQDTHFLSTPTSHHAALPTSTLKENRQ